MMFLEAIYISKILYFLTLLVLTSGLFIMLTSDNYVRKIIGLSVMQSSVLIFYLMLGKVNGGIVPIERSLLQDSYNRPLAELAYAKEFEGDAERRTAAYSSVREDSSTASLSKLPAEVEFCKRSSYSSPLPQVLMLTAIVVGFATLSLGLSLIYRISKQFNTISEHEINFSEATND